MREGGNERSISRERKSAWKTFLNDLEAAGPDGGALPAFVVSEIEAFLKCGILAHGLVLLKGSDCGGSRAAAFSCQRRGFCPSRIGRRMCDFAARLGARRGPWDWWAYLRCGGRVSRTAPQLRPARPYGRQRLTMPVVIEQCHGGRQMVAEGPQQA
jgi:hypothetical protein